MLKIGEKVVFVHTSYIEYGWELNENEIYIINNKAFDKMAIETLYGVKHQDGTESTWYKEQDLLSIKQLRKQKLDKINESRR